MLKVKRSSEAELFTSCSMLATPFLKLQIGT
jgi:hypothetical protein